MNGKFLIRGYAPADEAALTALWKRCFGDSEELIHGFFALLPELGAGVTAELDGKPVGMAFAICGMALSSGEKCGYIYAVAVDESCRGFGAGAGTGELCGAVTGAVMVLDLLTPADPADVIGSKKRSVGQAKELQKRFAERFDALRCADLLQKKFVPDDTTPAAKALGLTGHCDIMIATAVEIVEQMIAER